LPVTSYVFAEWKELTVAFDYHVDIDQHYYSVPQALVGHTAWARFSAASGWRPTCAPVSAAAYDDRRSYAQIPSGPC
jgi:hypothetical protein